jgi:malonate-semialdehyde dehydrogenase (acetylating)/methylmalonate-semialdehyde dehydrogenase
MIIVPVCLGGLTLTPLSTHAQTNQDVLCQAPDTTAEEFEAIVSAAQEAFPAWKAMSLLGRQQIMFKFAALLREHQQEIARVITSEQGKTFGDAMGDVLRGLQVVEFATGAPSLLLDKRLEVSSNMDTFVRTEPLGVTASINPFNFPAMCPLWSIPVALVTGNTHIVKPSERVPGASQIIVELAEKAGVPPGVLSVVHGTHDTVNRICDDPRIKAISFVGSDRGGAHVYHRGTKNGKRVQSNLGAKNHAVLMPDADKDAALDAIAGAAFGAAGQRCMALSVVVTVGDAGEWIEDGIMQRAKALKVGNGIESDVDLGPLISPAARKRVIELIGSCEKEGGKILLDGREFKADSLPDGNWVGPSILEAKPGMSCYDQEIFGPALVVIRAKTIDEALAIVNENPYGNGAAVFTTSGNVARRFEMECNAGQIGVNVAVPVPLVSHERSSSSMAQSPVTQQLTS